MIVFFFFFQAEDGIRDRDVTGVQTCAFRSRRLGLVPCHGSAGRECAAARVLCTQAGAGHRAVAPPAHRARPEPGRRLPGRRSGHRGDVRCLPLPDLLPPGGASFFAAASATAAYLASHSGRPDTVHALVHGYRVATIWATAVLVLGGVVAAVLIDAGRSAPQSTG